MRRLARDSFPVCSPLEQRRSSEPVFSRSHSCRDAIPVASFGSWVSLLTNDRLGVIADANNLPGVDLPRTSIVAVEALVPRSS